MASLGTLIDRGIGLISPRWGASRLHARATMSQIEAISGSPMVGYEGGKINSQTRGRTGARSNENAISRQQISRLRWQAWNLYRNNPHARKIVRTLVAKVIGRGPQPQSQAVNVDGSPNVEFRTKAQELWASVQCELDYRGCPGYGGQTMTGLLRVALRSAILSGEVLWRWRPVTTREQKKCCLHVPLKLQLVDPERLTEQNFLATAPIPEGNYIFHGIELNADGQRIAYWILNQHPSDPYPSTASMTASRFPADEIGHLFVDDDIDQLRGVTWFAPAILQMRDTGDYQYNELKASAIASCVAMGIKRPGSQPFGAANPQGWEPVDSDGNKITALQPGLVVDLGTDGELVSFNPTRPATNTEAFIQHMTRSTACALPGVKSSTLTGDYRNSSFSSERAADNDTWPEILDIQEWFYSGMVQPIYERVITAGVESGYFDGVITSSEFSARKQELLACVWQGPALASINPVDDATAALERVANGSSSPQIEAASRGVNWRDILKQHHEFREVAKAEGIADALIDQMLGLKAVARVTEQGTPENPTDPAANSSNSSGPKLANGGNDAQAA